MLVLSCRLPLAADDLTELPAARRGPSVLLDPRRHRAVPSCGACLLDPVCVNPCRHGVLGADRACPRDGLLMIGCGGLTARHGRLLVWLGRSTAGMVTMRHSIRRLSRRRRQIIRALC